MTKRHMVSLLALALIGCGGGGGEASEGEHEHHAGGEHEHDGEHGHHHGEDGEHGHRMSPGLHAYHEVLAPVWHSEPGVTRAQAACANATQLFSMSPDVDAAAVEGLSEAAAAEHATTAANDAAVALRAACAEASTVDESNAAPIEAALSTLHDAFHHAMEEWQHHQGGAHAE